MLIATIMLLAQTVTNPGTATLPLQPPPRPATAPSVRPPRTTVPAAPPANPQATVDLGAFTEFPCFENRTKYVIAGYARSGGDKVDVVRVLPNSGGCIATLRPDPVDPGMTVGTAFLDRPQVTQADLLGREVKCFMSLKAMKSVGFRVVVTEDDSGLYCESVRIDGAK